MRCCFGKCWHEDKENDLVKYGNKYYHEDCYMVKKDIEEIEKIFYEKVNKNVVFSSLRSVINNIIFNKGIQSSFLLFALKYQIDNKLPLNYPPGLYYVVQNRDIKIAWDKQIAKQQEQKMVTEVKDDDDNGKFNYNPKKKKSINDLLGG